MKQFTTIYQLTATKNTDYSLWKAKDRRPAFRSLKLRIKFGKKNVKDEAQPTFQKRPIPLNQRFRRKKKSTRVSTNFLYLQANWNSR